MGDLLYPIVLPIAAGILCLLIPKKLKGLVQVVAVLGALVTFALTAWLFPRKGYGGDYLAQDNLSAFILMAIGLFGVLTVIYSLGFMAGKKRIREYYAYVLMTLGAACGAILANNLVLLLVFWGFLGLTLYLLIGIGGPVSAPAAKKTLVIIGGSDALMLLGIAVIGQIAGTLTISEVANSPLALTGGLAALAFICLALASFAKAGAMPLHTWIPDMAETAPVPVTAYLPASLDKLLGIYLLARISTGLFEVGRAWGLLLLIVGAVTIVAAVMMALIQHDLKRLLSYHAVSQVGYMVLGIGTGNPVGIAGGIFHMLNHAIYKACLFFCGGAVEHRTGTSDLEKLGGLAKVMPVTFVTCLIAALSISGIPPFNGFVSKWMVYQGIIELGKSGGKLWIIWLVAAMFGSALTLASFMKLIHATFLGQRPKEVPSEVKGGPEIKEVGMSMRIPIIVLALLCVVFGVFAYTVPLKHFIFPAVPGVSFPGIWSPGMATILIIFGIIIGFIIYLLGNVKGVRKDIPFIGGEVLPEEVRVTGVDFYDTVREIKPLEGIYRQAEKKGFDPYDRGRKLTAFLGDKLKALHAGLLPAYLLWVVLGMAILFFVMVK